MVGGLNLVTSAPAILAAFLASSVEFVEALTVVLALGAIRGWRGALAGSAGGLSLLLLIVAAFGRSLAGIPLGSVQLVVGALLLLFGLRWLRKSVLRMAGIIPLHDETALFAKETAALRDMKPGSGRFDHVAVVGAFQIVMLEGIEVVFIVVAIGAGGPGLLLPAALGALIALLVVVACGAVLHRPISALPENTLKFAVGAILSAFGTFWVGEGIGVEWPGGDLSLAGLIPAYLLVGLVCARSARHICDAAGGRP